MKKVPLKRKSTLRANSRRPVKKQVKKRIKLPTIKTLRTKADNLLTPVIKCLSPSCEACGSPTQVGHHWIEKSRSSNLRYNLENIIPLCHSCHSKIHNRFGNSIVGGLDVAEIIIQHRGKSWKERMDREAKVEVKTDRAFYQVAHLKLSLYITNI